MEFELGITSPGGRMQHIRRLCKRLDVKPRELKKAFHEEGLRALTWERSPETITYFNEIQTWYEAACQVGLGWGR